MKKKVVIYLFIFLTPFLIDIFGENSFVFDKRNIILKKESLAATQDFSEDFIIEEVEKKKGFNINVVINNINNNEGLMRIALFNNSNGFPGSYENSILSETAIILNTKGFSTTLKFLEKGEYAIAVFHDKNSNSNLDTGIFGIPLEQYGFSNNPTINFRAPTFEECKFILEEDKSIVINLN